MASDDSCRKAVVVAAPGDGDGGADPGIERRRLQGGEGVGREAEDADPGRVQVGIVGQRVEDLADGIAGVRIDDLQVALADHLGRR